MTTQYYVKVDRGVDSANQAEDMTENTGYYCYADYVDHLYCDCIFVTKFKIEEEYVQALMGSIND